MHFPLRACVLFLLIIFGCTVTLNAKTRRSTFHSIPDADLLEGGGILFDASGYFLIGSSEGLLVKPFGYLNLGIIEWVNISGGYAGGPTFGLKARILGETKVWMPSLAIGVKNIYSHEESYWYNVKDDTMSTEIYCAIGKSIDNLRLRMNVGVQSIPDNDVDKINLFAGAEKYFGRGLYLTFEFFTRQEDYVMSLFVDWRFFKNRAEVYAGVVDIAGWASGKNKDVESVRFVKPGIRGGLRFYINMKRGKTDAFTSLEDRIASQNTTITSLKNDIDSLKAMMTSGSSRLDGLSKSVQNIVDSASVEDGRYKAITIEKLSALNAMYEQEPFEPEQVKTALRELVVHRDNILPALFEVALDKKEGTRIRSIAVSVCGEIGTSAASDILIEILGQTQVPELKIEALIALGKLKELRATYLMQQLATDPNDAVAFTASEVLQKLENETGIPLVTPAKTEQPLESIPENKIGARDAGRTGLNEIIKETTQNEAIVQPMQKVERKEFTESSVEETNESDSLGNGLITIDTTSISSESTLPPEVKSNPSVIEDADSTTQDVNTSIDTTAAVVAKQAAEPVAVQDTASQSKEEETKSSRRSRRTKERVEETGDW